MILPWTISLVIVAWTGWLMGRQDQRREQYQQHSAMIRRCQYRKALRMGRLPISSESVLRSYLYKSVNQLD